MNELPDVMVEPSKLFLCLQEGSGVRDGRVDFELVPYNFGVDEQPGNVILGVLRDFSGVKIIKRFSITLSFSQNGGPAQACLRTFQNQKLKQASVVVNWYAPFVIMIGRFQLTPIGPFTTFHDCPTLNLIGRIAEPFSINDDKMIFCQKISAGMMGIRKRTARLGIRLRKRATERPRVVV